MNSMNRQLAALLFCGVLASAQVCAQETSSPTAPVETETPFRMAPPKVHTVRGLEGEPLELTVRQAVFATIARNLDVRLRLHDRDISASEVFAQYGIYDPVLGARVSRTRRESAGSTFGDSETRTDSTGSSGGRRTTTDTGEASISQLLPLGTLLELSAFDQRTDTDPSGSGFDPSYESGVGIQVTQPLLQNFGTLVNNANIMIARRELDQANQAFRRELEVKVGEVVSAYWNLDFAMRNLDAQMQSLESAQELLRVNQARVDVGSEPRVVLLQTQADVAAREFAVAEAEAALIRAQDTLLATMAWGIEEDFRDWDRPIIPAEQPTYDAEIRVSDSYAYEQALARRPDYLSAMIDVDIADINRRVARQQRLPELNAFGGYNVNGLDDSRSGSWSDTGDLRYEGYNFGAELRFPLFNRQRRGQYQQTINRQARAETFLEQYELNIRTEVREATRGIRTALVQIDAARRRVRAAEENVAAEMRRLEVGESTTFEVLDFQDDLAEARAAEARALADLQIALINLGTSTGYLLDVVGITFEDQPAPSGFDLGFEPTGNANTSVAKAWADWREMLRSGI